jgi:hypothetical protein
MSGAPLPTLMNRCARSYRRFADVIAREDRDRIPLDEIIARWRDHYLGDFGELDRTMMREALSGRRPSDRYLAVSVSHHNLHRLIEVLELEIGAAPLSASQVPERILDLVEVVTRLNELLETATTRGPQETYHA